MNFIYLFILVSTSLLFSNSNINYGGTINYYYISKFSDREVVNLPFRLLDINFQYQKNNINLFTNFALEFILKDDKFSLKNTSPQDFTLDLREMYLTWYTDNGELRVGKQLFSWGNADENSPLDNLSPIDYLYLFESGKDRKLGVYSLAWDGYTDNNLTYGFMLSPLHNTHRLPKGYSDFPIQVPLPNPYRIMEVPKDQPEFGTFINKSFDNGDLRLSYFNGYDRIFSFTGLNAFQQSESIDNPTEIDTVYSFRKTQVLGIGGVTFLGPVTLRMDFAFFETKDPYSNISRDNPQPWLANDVLGGYFNGIPNNLTHLAISYPWAQKASYGQSTIQIEVNTSDVSVLAQYFYHKLIDYQSNDPLNVVIPQESTTISIDPEYFFFPGMGSPLAILTRNALMLNFDYEIDNFNSMNFSTLYDIDQYGKLISIEYHRNILDGFSIKIGTSIISGNDNAPLDNLGQEYKFNALEDFSHLRMHLFYTF